MVPRTKTLLHIVDAGRALGRKSKGKEGLIAFNEFPATYTVISLQQTFP